MQANPVLGTRDVTTKILLGGGALAGPLFTAAWIAGGATTADFDPMQHAISSLSVGEFGWMQIVSFIITGTLLLGFAVGLWRALRLAGSPWGSLLIGLVGTGLIGAGIFSTDPLNGYPAGTPMLPTERTTHGILHDLFSVPFFLGLPIACIVFSRVFGRRLGKRSWAIYSTVSGITMFAVFFAARLGFRGIDELAALFGLLQRIVVSIGFLWLTLLAVYVLWGRVGTPIMNK